MSDPLEPRIAALLAEIPPEERATFEDFYQERLQLAIHAANGTTGSTLDADPDQVEEELVEALMREADGRDSASGMGSVPTAEGEYELIPPETDPRLLAPSGRTKGAKTSSAPSSGQMTPGRWAAVAVALLVPLVWLIWSVAGKSPAEASAGTGTPTTPITTTLALMPTPTPLTDFSGGSDVTVAYPASLEIAREDAAGPDVYRVMASASQLGGTWEPELQPGVAAWLNGSYINHVFCLPPGARTTVEGLARGSLMMMRPASGAVRAYEVVRVRQVGRQEVEVLDQRRAGMTLILCGEGQNERTIVEAAYRPEQAASPILRRGQPATLPDLARLTVQTVTTLAPTSTIPTGYAELVLEVQVDNLMDQVWTSREIADQLDIDGAIAERIAIEDDAIDAHAARRVTYRYLVPEAGGAAIWRATAITGESIAVAVTVPPAPDGVQRSPYTTTIDPTSVRVSAARSGRLVTVTAIITATGPDPAPVNRDAVTVWIGGRSIPLDASSSSLPVFVQPGAPTTLTLVAEVPDVAQFEIQIGAQRWRLTLP